MSITAIDTKISRGARSIATQIKRAIETGTLTNGDQLPPERELSERYEASRSTIRKALNILETDGLISRKVGSGTFIDYSGSTEIDVDNVVDQISPIQLIETRIGFERQMLRLAVVHATARNIERMENILDAMEASENDREHFTQQDSEFHLTLAKASGNPLIVQLYNQINEIRTHSQWRNARELVLSPEKIRAYNVFHRDILNGLKNRSISNAIEALNAHMELAQKDLMGTNQLD